LRTPSHGSVFFGRAASPRGRGQPVDLLEGIADAEQPRPAPAPPALVGQRPVEVAAAHAQPVAGGVERHQRKQQQVERPCRQQLAPRDVGLGDAEAVAREGGVRRERCKAQQRPRAVDQHRQVDPASAGPGPLHQVGRVHLAVVGQVGRHPPGADVDRLAGDPPRQHARRGIAHLGRQRAAPGAQLAAQPGALVVVSWSRHGAHRMRRSRGWKR
jgi:hypothetical protein